MYSIAIDGPAGAGKSTIAKAVAKRLEYIYVDTGAMYRAMGLYLIREGIAAEEEKKIEALLDEVEIKIIHQKGAQRIFLFEEDITEAIREEKIGNMASAISVYAGVRDKLVALQREIARHHNVVMDGRDIGSVVLPHADLKIYLTAEVAERARRRYKELEEKGIHAQKSRIEEDIRERDERDMNREHSPLCRAKDAYLLDCTKMSIEEVIEKILSLIREKKETGLS